MTNRKSIQKHSSSSEVNAFLSKVAATPLVKTSDTAGRLIFAMDATASREPAWDRASHLQAEMFSQTTALGGLAVQLCYYSGQGEFHASRWSSSSQELLAHMTEVRCRSGLTQIHKVLQHTLKQTAEQTVNALVFIGDCVEEDAQLLAHEAGKLGMYGTRVFMFQEGADSATRNVFQSIAHLTHGAYCSFDANSAQQLKELLGAVAVYAAGGTRALQNYSKGKSQDILRLSQQIYQE